MNINDNQNPINMNLNPKELVALYLNRDYDALTRKFVNILNYFSGITFLQVNPDNQTFINLFVDTFLYLFIKPDYIINNKQAELFITYNPIISNLVAMSCYKNTDAQLELLKNYENNFFKVLTLYSARNTSKFSIRELFDINPRYASIWYFYYFMVDAFYSETMNQNILDHLNNLDERLELISSNINFAYFIPTYYATDNEKRIKQKINNLIKKPSKNVEVSKNEPKKNKIAIISHRWADNSAIYKSNFSFLQELSKDYELTLIHIGPTLDNIESSLFKEIKHIRATHTITSFSMDLSAIDPDFMMAFYLDVGLNMESIYLANLRIAPVQIMTYGHPVSTFGSEIDYFIGGSEAELLDKANDNYSERLVIIPGIGAYPVYPVYEKKNMLKNKNKFIIACAWGLNKFNNELLLTLKLIMEKANKKIMFRFFPGVAATRSNEFIPLQRELFELFGKENVEVVPYKDYEEYMNLMESTDIAIDSYPFGSYNTIVDALYLSKPIISYEGTHAYNRIASAVLRRVGMEELVTNNKDEYINKVLNLINNDDYREDLINKISEIDLKSKIFNTNEPVYFKKAVDYLIDNYAKLKNEDSKEPIIISA